MENGEGTVVNGSMIIYMMPAKLFGITELLHAATDRLFTVGNHADGANFAIGFSNGNGNSVSVDIQTNKSYFVHDRFLPFVYGSALIGLATDSVIRHTTEHEQESVFFYIRKTATLGSPFSMWTDCGTTRVSHPNKWIGVICRWWTDGSFGAAVSGAVPAALDKKPTQDKWPARRATGQ